MNLKQIKNKLKSSEYDFLRTDEHLGKRIALITLGGSHAYGTSNENSDLDVRGFTLDLKREILTNDKFDQFINNPTDTVIYGFNKLITLLSNCNPNTIEMLGCNPKHYLYVSPIGKELLDNAKLFLSKKVIYTFGGYAAQQLRRLDNKSARLLNQTQREIHILNSINNASYSFKEKYFSYNEDNIKLYVDKSMNPEYDSEIFMNINLSHYPLRDYVGMVNEMNNIIKSYNKIGRRNEHAIEHNKLGKHMMHLIRLYIMCLDILENEQIVTYREKEHDLLMDIRNGKYLDSNKQPIPEFFEMIDEYKKKMNYAKENTSLPNNVDYKKINDFTESVNERIVKNEF